MCVVCAMSGKRHNTLSLIDKVKLIEMRDKDNVPVKDLISRFKCGKTQVYDTLKNKDAIWEEWLSGKSNHLRRRRVTGNEDINNAVYDWFIEARAKHFPLSGPIIQARALQIAAKLGKHDFKASNGWLDSFKQRYYIVWNEICNKRTSKDLNVDVEGDWKTKISSLVKGYSVEDIYSGDEMGLFFRMLPTCNAICEENCADGEMSEERLTVFVCANASGDIEKPFVVGKVDKPRCFGNLDRESLPVIWRSNKRAWMTRALMEEWLVYFDSKMRGEDRNVLLFLDTAACHPRVTLSNVKLVWFPPNTTAFMLPIQSVLHMLKTWYRKSLLQFLAMNVREYDDVKDLTKNVTALNAINWIAGACRKIPSEAVKASFSRADFPICEEFAVKSDIADELANLCLCFNLTIPIDTDRLISFDANLSTEAEEMENDELFYEENIKEEEEEETENRIQTFPELSAVLSNLQKFAALNNCPKLLQLMVEAEEVAADSFLQNGV